MNNHTTPDSPEPVIFRMWKGDIIALFPAWCNSLDGPHLVMSYMSLGGHGSANYNIIVDESRLATEEEYARIRHELENLYEYYLKVCKKRTKKHRQEAEEMYRGYREKE